MESPERELTVSEGWVVGSTVDHKSLESSVAGTFHKSSHPVNWPERALFPKSDNS